MRSHVQILTTPTADTPGTTLLLHFDNKRYLLGSLAEGTQRACVQMGTRLIKVSECFITGRSEWANTGGLIGMILTLADSGAASQAAATEEALKKVRARAKKLGVENDPAAVRAMEDEVRGDARNTFSLFGPRNLNHTLATARRYVFRKGMPVDVHEIREGGRARINVGDGDGEEWAPYWADENVKVWAMEIWPPAEGRLEAEKTSSTSISPRKRSIDEVYAQENSNETMPVTGEDLTQEERDYLEVKAVVAEMFNSSWRLDTLHETRLSDVKLPATIFVRNQETKKTEKYSGPLPGGAQPLPDPNMMVLVRKPWPGALVESLPDTEPSLGAVSYIFKNHVQRGKFFPDKARNLKVSQGPKWAALTSGQNVLNDDGETITPEMVLGPNKEGGGIAVIDLPTSAYIDPVISRYEWRQPEVMSGVGAVVWICGKEVATDPRLHSFMQEFKHLQHIVSSPDYCSNYIALDSAAAATVRLKQVDPDRYGIPVHDTETPDGVQQYGGSARCLAVRKQHPLPDDVHIAARGQYILLHPSVALKTDQVIPSLDIAKTVAEMVPEVLKEATKAQQAITTPEEEVEKWLASLPPGARETEIVTLGTGSALPSKYRNVSGNLVRIPDWGNIILDCGENTLGQLKRIFSEEELRQVLRDLRIISISHMHADHQLGTTSIIKAWYEEVHGGQPASEIPDDTPLSSLIQSQNRLAIVSEPAMQHWLAEYSAVEDFGYSHLAPITVSPEQAHRNLPTRLHWFVPPSTIRRLPPTHRIHSAANHVPPSALGLAAFDAVSVQHCHGARAVSLTLPSGLKISYSGDCRPSRAFARIGRGSTVCIHEATFDDELRGDAVAKNHSTTSEALGIAQAMRAKACVLTHFSQRYQKVPVLERAEDCDGGEVNLAMGEGNGEVEGEKEEEGEAAFEGPFEDGEAAGNVGAPTFPDQVSADGGRQYELPAAVKGNGTAGRVGTAISGPPEAVKFKLASDMKVCVAFDYMRVKIGDIGHMEKFTPALLKLFAEEEKAKAVEEGGGDGEGDGGNATTKKQGKKKGGKRNN